MTAFWICYLGGVIAQWPLVVRDRYHRLRAQHPHTHPRDVRYDLDCALAGSWRAFLWWPWWQWLGWCWRRFVVWVAVHIIGKAQVAYDVREARVEMWEAELAASDPS